MIRNYLKVAWRTIIRNKTFSAINILGLALGITSSLLIMLWVADEKSVDAFHENGKHLFQVYERHHYDGKIEASYFTQGLLASELKKNFPEIEFASSLEQKAPRPFIFEAGNKIMKMDGSFASPDLFHMFSYPLISGNKETALNTPGGIAISRRMAEQFFGDPTTAVGKSIRFESNENLMVTAVFENIPANSSQQFDFLRSWQDYTQQQAWVSSWGSASPYTYLQLRKDADPGKVEAKLRDFIHRYVPKTKKSYTELALQSYPEKYLHSSFKNGWIGGGRIEYVQLFSLVAVFILLIACINFMNLSTARSSKRAKEVGIRKVVGAERKGLIGQFIGEAMLLVALSTIIACLLALVLLPPFNEFTGKNISMPVTQPLFWLTIFALILITGIVAGSYPAFFLSSFHPIRVLKGSLRFSPGALFFRKGLVVFQFALSVILIVGMMVIYRQVNYIQTKNLGYDRENLVYIPIEGDLIKRYDLFKQQASLLPGVLNVSNMRESPTVIGHHTGDVSWQGKDPTMNMLFTDAAVSYDFARTMNLKFSAGRDFSTDFESDSTSYLLNEAAAKKIGYENPVGMPLELRGKNGSIIGVLKDFHFNSMHETIEPLVIRLNNNQSWGTILVRIGNGRTSEALTSLESLCKELNPGFPFTYQFSDEEYAKLYKSEQVASTLVNYFAFLAIFISCLGLFGLATFTAEQRTKEIGVRKALGASVPDIVRLLAANFLKPVAIAMVIAFPVAWWLMNNWLRNFAYKTDLSWWVFAVAALLTVGIALFTVSFKSIKAALMNPVKSLRTE